MSKFAKVFDFEEGQVLVKRHYDQRDETNVIEISTIQDDIEFKATVGYNTPEESRTAFDLIDEEYCHSFYTDIANNLNEEYYGKI
jgi:uncharacterized protein YrzB (UPF0473 family)